VAALLLLVVGEKGSARIGQVGAWLRVHGAVVIAALLAVVGVVVGIVGLSHLA
jgi:hypothetical protein